MFIELVSSGRWVWEVIVLPYVIVALWSLCSDGIEAISHFPLSCYVMWCFLRGRSHRSYPLHYTELTSARRKVWRKKQMCSKKEETQKTSELEFDVNTLPACSAEEQLPWAAATTTLVTTKATSVKPTLEPLSLTTPPSNNILCTKTHICRENKNKNNNNNSNIINNNDDDDENSNNTFSDLPNSNESCSCIEACRWDDKQTVSQKHEESNNKEKIIKNASSEGVKTNEDNSENCDGEVKNMTNSKSSNCISSSIENSKTFTNTDHSNVVIIQRRLLLGRHGEVHLWVRPTLSTPLIPSSFLLPFSHSLHELVSNVIGPIQQPTVLTLPNYHVRPQWPPHYSTRYNSRSWDINNKNNIDTSLAAAYNSSSKSNNMKAIPSYLYSYSSSSEGATTTLTTNVSSLINDANRSTSHRPYVSTDEYNSSNVNTNTRRLVHHRLSLLPSLTLPDTHIRRRTREEHAFTSESNPTINRTAASTSASSTVNKKPHIQTEASVPLRGKLQNSLSALRSCLFSTLPSNTSRSSLSSLPAWSEMRQMSTNPNMNEESEGVNTNRANSKNASGRTQNVVYRIINTHDESDSDTSSSLNSCDGATSAENTETCTKSKRVNTRNTLQNVSRWWHGHKLYGSEREQQSLEQYYEEEKKEEHEYKNQEKGKKKCRERFAGPGRKSDVFIHPIASITSHHVLSYQATRQKVLVMDLDETLCHVATSTANMTIPPSFSEVIPTAAGAELFHVWVRPHVPLFLSTMSRLFNLVLFTSAAQPYAETILRRIDPQKHFSRHLFRQHCRLVKRGALARMISNNTTISNSKRSSNQTSNNSSFAKNTPSQPAQPTTRVGNTNNSIKVMSTMVQNKRVFNENSKVFVKDLRMLKVPLELCVMIDNCEECLLLNRENALIIAPYIPSSELMHQTTNINERNYFHMDDNSSTNFNRDSKKRELGINSITTAVTSTANTQTSELAEGKTCIDDTPDNQIQREQNETDVTTIQSNNTNSNKSNNIREEENRSCSNECDANKQISNANNNNNMNAAPNAETSSLVMNANTVFNESEADEDDDLLLALMPFLESLLTVPDVRSILRYGKTY